MSETRILREIELAIGSFDDLLLLRNNVGIAKHRHVNARGMPVEYTVAYGLSVGSPDLIGFLTAQTKAGPRAFVIALEVKAEDGRVDANQTKCHELWRRFGVFVAVVRSAQEALAQVSLAREWARAAVSP